MRFVIADMSLAEFGRKEIVMAENEMPGWTIFLYYVIRNLYYSDEIIHF